MIFGGFVCILCKIFDNKFRELLYFILFLDFLSVFVMGRLFVGIFLSYG